MAGRTVLFGATGYTGRLVAEAMVERGIKPVLAARNAGKLDQLADELGGGLETAVADVSDPPSVSALVERGDVLVTTVGPFARWGAPAAAAATTAGAHYVDSTGEPGFIREVFERYGPAADRAGCGMLTAFGYDWVPGNLAAGLALREAGEDAVRVDIGYFVVGSGSPSGGTRATMASSSGKPGFAFRDGRVQAERTAKRMRGFSVGSKRREGVSVGASEHFTLPRIAPQLREVNVYLGWFGPFSRVVQAISLGASLPGVSTVMRLAGERFVKGSSGGPDAEERSKSGSHIVAIAYDGAGRELAEVHVAGVNGYTFTGRILAWGAHRAAEGGLQGTGALGPEEAFGLVALTDGCRWAGLEQESSSGDSRAASVPGRAPVV
jgi:short subunit dehydrogenase-like uncharacterized protein